MKPLFPGRQLFRCSMAIMATLLAVILVAELSLRINRRMIKRSNRIDPGMFLYDMHLGWRLAPNWEGRHKHWDFDVRYSINSYGFRGSFDRVTGVGGLCYAFLGDSYTFGFGVNCDETFVEILNSENAEGDVFLNFAVPGFSTDQECLLMERRVFEFSPGVIVLVVCLSNDLLDNELPFPIQAERAKPYFRMMRDTLVAKNIPVPLGKKPEDAPGPDLMNVVFGCRCCGSESLVHQCLQRSELLWWLMDGRRVYPSINFEERFGNSLRLFEAIILRVKDRCHENDVRLVIALMPGKSFVERPDSSSAQFQGYLRTRVMEIGMETGVKVIDIAGTLSESYRKNHIRLFLANEGHLNEQGHRLVADILARNLNQDVSAPCHSGRDDGQH